jgi:predicted RNA-binding Zn-ribbon protein involved in translation (DUF1610 family)
MSTITVGLHNCPNCGDDLGLGGPDLTALIAVGIKSISVDERCPHCKARLVGRIEIDNDHLHLDLAVRQ